MSHHFIVYVNSKFRLVGTSADFFFNIDLPRITGYDEYDSVCVLQANIPKSYYLINTGRDTFTLSENGTQVAIQIPAGNYTRRSLATVVRNLLRTASPNGLLYDISVPNVASGPETGRYLYTVLYNPSSIAISFLFGSTSSPAAQMGFDSNSVNLFDETGLFSTKVANLQAASSMYILCDNVVNGHTNILQEIFTASPDFSSIDFNVGFSGGIAANVKSLKTTLTNVWRFQFVSPSFELFDFEGLDVVFSMLIWKSKESKPINEEALKTVSQSTQQN